MEILGGLWKIMIGRICGGLIHTNGWIVRPSGVKGSATNIVRLCFGNLAGEVPVLWGVSRPW